MSEEQLEEIGPIDYIVMEWSGDQPVTGEVMPLIVDLADRGIIRVLDIAFVSKERDGSVIAIDIGDLAQRARASPTSRARRRACWARTTSRTPPPRWSPGPSPRCSSGRTAGRRPSPPRCAARAASSSRAAASPSRPSSPRSTRARPSTDREEHRMPGLLRGVARTAVIAGTATAVSNRVSRRQAQRWSQQGANPYDEPSPRTRSPPARRRRHRRRRRPTRSSSSRSSPR